MLPARQDRLRQPLEGVRRTVHRSPWTIRRAPGATPAVYEGACGGRSPPDHYQTFRASPRSKASGAGNPRNTACVAWLDRASQGRSGNRPRLKPRPLYRADHHPFGVTFLAAGHPDGLRRKRSEVHRHPRRATTPESFPGSYDVEGGEPICGRAVPRRRGRAHTRRDTCRKPGQRSPRSAPPARPAEVTRSNLLPAMWRLTVAGVAGVLLIGCGGGDGEAEADADTELRVRSETMIPT
jgi:hypothetical protein